MNHWKDLYNLHTDRYERLAQHEDVDGNLLPALVEICELDNARVAEFGAGTGRISSQIAPLVEQLWAFDLTPAMVRVAQQKRLSGQVGELANGRFRLSLYAPPQCVCRCCL